MARIDLPSAALAGALLVYGAMAPERAMAVERACPAPSLVSTVLAYKNGGIPPTQPVNLEGMAELSPYFARMLQDPARISDWSDTVCALSIIGDRTAYDALEKFLYTRASPGHGPLPSMEFTTKIETIYALGYIALRSPDNAVKLDAEEMLRKHQSTKSWGAVKWDSPDHARPEARDAYLTGKARFILKAVESKKRESISQ
jgi:hypothetical protein